MDAMEQIRQTFFQEAEELLAELESGLLALDMGKSKPMLLPLNHNDPLVIRASASRST